MTKEDYNEANRLLLRLGEIFESVLIIATVNEEGVTQSFTRYTGNYYASKGLAHEWLESERDKEMVYRLKDFPEA